MTPTSSYRMQRIGNQIQQTLAKLLTIKVHDPRLMGLSILEVEVSPDMSHATVFISQLSENQIPQTLTILNKAASFFRRELAHSLNLRITPKLKFKYDDSIVRGRQLTDLMDRIMPGEASND